MRTKVVLRRRRRRKGVYIASAVIFALALLLFSVRPSASPPAGDTKPLPDGEINLDTAKGALPSPTQAPQQTQKVEVPELNFYAIQFGAYDNEENARVEAARYVKRGAAGYVLKDGEVSRVLGAAYVSREAAERVAMQLKSEEQIECYIYAGHADPVTLKITATQAQIDAVKEGIRMLRDETEIVGALGFEIDKGEIGLEEALKSLAAAQARIDKSHAAYIGAVGENGGAVISGISKRLEAFSGQLGALLAEKDLTAMSLSSKMKYAAIDMWLSQAEYIQEITQGA